MIPGTFTHDHDEDDIVTLSSPESNKIAVKGWVNIGEHAIELMLDSNGGLSIQTYAKGHEVNVLASVQVPRLAATLVRLRGERGDEIDPARAFADDLASLGFGTDDSINGADTVEAVNRHFDNLRALADPLASVVEETE